MYFDDTASLHVYVFVRLLGMKTLIKSWIVGWLEAPVAHLLWHQIMLMMLASVLVGLGGVVGVPSWLEAKSLLVHLSKQPVYYKIHHLLSGNLRRYCQYETSEYQCRISKT
jgi:hypothetical protein